MTPQEAVDEMVAHVYIDPEESPAVLGIIEAVEATAKADETRRCVAETKELAESNKVALCDSTGDVRYLLHVHATHLLTTGGLEVEG